MYPTNKPTKDIHMLIKTTIALAMALALGVSSAALARSGGSSSGGFRELGPGGTAIAGVNPTYHPSLGGEKIEVITSDGRCWLSNNGTNYHWGYCHR
jgi:hypothetical protein